VCTFYLSVTCFTVYHSSIVTFFSLGSPLLKGHVIHWNFALVQKGSNVKKRKSMLYGTVQDWNKFTTQIKDKTKVFFNRHFYTSLIIPHPNLGGPPGSGVNSINEVSHPIRWGPEDVGGHFKVSGRVLSLGTRGRGLLDWGLGSLHVSSR
jgi:hypothetical protein